MKNNLIQSLKSNLEIIKSNPLIENIEIYNDDEVIGIEKGDIYISINHYINHNSNYEFPQILSDLILKSKNCSEYKIENNLYETQIII